MKSRIPRGCNFIQATAVGIPAACRTRPTRLYTAGAPMRSATTCCLTLLATVTFAAPLRAEPSALPEALRVVADSLLALSRGTGGGGQWGDPSDAAREAFRSRQDRLSAMLRAIPRPSLATDEDRLLYDNLLEVVEGSRASRGCRFHLWYSPSMFAGWHLAAANWARITNVADDDGRARTLQALRELPAAIGAERALLARGLDSGFTQSAQVI